MKPIDLDNRELIIRLTRMDGRQYDGAMKAIKPFFRKIEGKGYIFEWGDRLWHESLDKHISYSDRGKKGASVKLERARERLEEYQRLQSLYKDNTKSLPNKNSDSEVIPENKESDLAKLKHNSKTNNNKLNKERRKFLQDVIKDTAKNKNPSYLEEKEKKGSFGLKQFRYFHIKALQNISSADHIDYLKKLDLLSDQDKEEIGQSYFNTKTLEQPLKLLESKIKWFNSDQLKNYKTKYIT